MRTNDLTTHFASGKIVFADKVMASEFLAWNEHPKFKGVYLKHLITGSDTGGRFSVHLVHIAEGCVIGDHIHATQYELHEVLEGMGECQMDNKTIAYIPGVCTVIPEGIHHSVFAQQSDLYLLATFIPPLL